MSSVTALILGSLISLLSAVVGMALQYFLDIRKMVYESKEHPSRVLYDKQIEFFDALTPLFDKINGYITTIDVWLGETGDSAKAKVKEAVQDTVCLTEMEQLLQQYNLYIPSEPLNKLHDLQEECRSLSSHPDSDKTFQAINLLFETQNAIREFVGVDKLSQDLMRAMGHRRVKQSNAS